MDPLKTAHLTAQDLVNPATNKKPDNQEFLSNVAATDDCGLDILSLFDADSATTTLFDQESEIAQASQQKIDTGVDLENLEVRNEIEKTALDATNEQIEVVSEKKINTGHEKARVSKHEEGALKAEEAASIAHLMQAEGAIDNVHVVSMKNGQLDVKKATDLHPDDLKTAHTAGATAFLHGKNIFMSPAFAAANGYAHGQPITYKNAQGVQQTVNVQILSPNDFKALSGLVTTHITNHPANAETEPVNKEKTHEKRHEMPIKHNVVVIHQSNRQVTNDDRRTRDAERVLSTSSSPLKNSDQVSTDQAREREHEARKIDQLKEKLFEIIMKDVKTYDIRHQNLLADNLKTDHELAPISRQQLNTVRQRSG